MHFPPLSPHLGSSTRTIPSTRSPLSIQTLVLATAFLAAIAWLVPPSLIRPNTVHAETDYPLGPDSKEHDGIPKGTLTHHTWTDSKVFPGTSRHYSVYVPAQTENADTKSEAAPYALMVFQDGHSYLAEKGDFRVPTVFDNLIAAGEMPPTIAVLIDPGFTSELPEKRGWKPRPENRAVEYDTVSGDYAEFLINEILPSIENQYSITQNPELRAIGGSSSGGICAFSVAWFRPDSFRKVLSNIGSFTDIRGGHNYPPMIRKADPKPIRVFLQDGSGDLDNRYGNWPLANQQMAKALAFQDYDYKFVYGDGGHNGKHGGSVFPDALRWLWRDWKQEQR
ncbi:enterochelin esterase [Neorhodopirellula lusitana]|uniref:Enterochelin esterase n=1 Tax=Neorhodopirellula lusitana TaxID=445327 RepID=A0ABY1QN56_9BACT|nr:enterochelin esterase [Neorhodopirellula lusitana]